MFVYNNMNVLFANKYFLGVVLNVIYLNSLLAGHYFHFWINESSFCALDFLLAYDLSDAAASGIYFAELVMAASPAFFRVVVSLAICLSSIAYCFGFFCPKQSFTFDSSCLPGIWYSGINGCRFLVVSGHFFSEPGLALSISVISLVFLYPLLSLVWKLPRPLVPIAHPWISPVLSDVAWNSLSVLAGGSTHGLLPCTLPISWVLLSSSLTI